MKADKRYAYLVNIIKELAKNIDYSDCTVDKWIKEPSSYFRYLDKDPLGDALELLQDAMTEMDTAMSPRSAISAIKSIIKTSERDGRKVFAGIFERDGLYCVSDGYRLIRLKNDLPSLPHVENYMDMKKLFNGVCASREELHLPSVSEIKQVIAITPKRDNPMILVDGLVMVNAEYLLNMMQALPDCKAYIPNRKIDPIYFESENGDGLLLPIRVRCDREEYNTIERNWEARMCGKAS